MQKPPLERAARALCELSGIPPGATMDGKPLWQGYLPEVRAVLEAIREPSAGMVEVASVAAGQLGPDDHAGIYRAMIDAALR